MRLPVIFLALSLIARPVAAVAAVAEQESDPLPSASAAPSPSSSPSPSPSPSPSSSMVSPIATAAAGAEVDALAGPQPFSGDPGWRASVLAGAGAVMLNTAGGQHLWTPELSLQGALRITDVASARTVVDFAWRRDGTSEIWVDNTYTVLTQRLDLTLGTDRAQFFAGAGPCAILTSTRLHGPGRNVHANEIYPGVSYGLGLRWMMRRLPMALDFGGQQRERRHDFRMSIAIGAPVVRSGAR